MISTAKLAANRANAMKSTGPRTAAGKARAAQNARRHGLRAAALADAGFSEKAKDLARLIAGKGANAEIFAAACRLAEAQMDHVRARTAWVAVRNQDPGFAKTPHITPWRLLAIERHASRALSRRKFALRDFDAACAAAGWFPPPYDRLNGAKPAAPVGMPAGNSARTNPSGHAAPEMARTNPPTGPTKGSARTNPLAS